MAKSFYGLPHYQPKSFRACPIFWSSKNMCSVRVKPIPFARKNEPLARRAVYRHSSVPEASYICHTNPSVPEVTGEFSRFRRYFSGINLSRRTVQGDVIAFFIYNAFDLHCLVLVVHIDGTGTGHTTFTHTTSHYGRMEVIPPRAVRIPSAADIPAKSSGEVSIRTITTRWPSSRHFWASSAWNTICPQAAPETPATLV